MNLDKTVPATRKIVKSTTEFFLEEPMVNWSHVENLTREFQGEMVRELDELIQRAVRLRAYVDMRHGSGCGDQGHKAAVKESNKLIARVRKALGFTYPRQDVSF